MTWIIRQLRIERFRGIESLVWRPDPGMNVILGGGDVGKTTILEAIALLLHPTPAPALTDTDYWLRDVGPEFVIEAVISLPEGTVTTHQYKMMWPWGWDGEKLVIPADTENDGGTQAEPVYVWRVRGTADMDLVHEVVHPNNKVEPLPQGVRRSIGLLRLIGDDRTEKDVIRNLLMLLGSRELRGHLLRQLAREDATQRLDDEAKKMLSVLESHFIERGLPSNLGLGITGGQGVSLNSLITLTAQKDGVALPLSSWGSGTRRLSALTIAKVMRSEPSVVLIDEIERALEPYRQRALVKELMASGSQVFITTHSPAVVAAAADASLWYMDARGKLGRLPRSRIIRTHQQRDPETFLARLTVVCEGATEVGFMSVILERTIGDYLEHGIWITDAGGNDEACALLDALAEAGLTFAGVVDNENKKSGTWSQINSRLGDLLIQWPTGCLEEHVIPLFDHDVLPELIADPKNELTGQRLRTLAVRLGIQDTKWETIVAAAGDRLVRLIIDAAKGDAEGVTKEKKGEYKGHAKVWFKSVEGGRELAEKVFDLGAWRKLKNDILPFVNAIRKALGFPQIEELPA